MDSFSRLEALYGMFYITFDVNIKIYACNSGFPSDFVSHPCLSSILKFTAG